MWSPGAAEELLVAVEFDVSVSASVVLLPFVAVAVVAVVHLLIVSGMLALESGVVVAPVLEWVVLAAPFVGLVSAAFVVLVAVPE